MRTFLPALVLLSALLGLFPSRPAHATGTAPLCAGTLAQRHAFEADRVVTAFARAAALETVALELEHRFDAPSRLLALFTSPDLRRAPLAPIYRSVDSARAELFLAVSDHEPRRVFRERSFAGWDLSAIPSCSLPEAPLLPPLPTPFGSRFGTRTDPFTGRPRHHAGLDFAAPAGTPVSAAWAGVVTRAEISAGGYGQLVEIDHGHGVRTRYAHLSAIHVSLADQIAPGAVIGLVGSTGRSTGPHLHFEVRLDGAAVDPVHWL